MQNPSAELLDIYDEDNHPIGQTLPRSEVHSTLAHRHRVTGIWIHNDQKQFLCQQCSLEKDVSPGMWHLTFGGHVRSGNTYEENVLDELYDEIGLAPELSELLFVGYSQNPVHKHHAANYLYCWSGQLDGLTLHDGEVAQVKWVTTPEHQQMLGRGEHAHPISPLLFEYLQRNQ